jgi:endonuclease/exonuclease/phosphatase family metal-dependent hydrolase
MKHFSRSSLAVALLAVALLVDAAPAWARAPHVIKVMTRNQYIGADLTPVILAQTAQEFLAAATAALTQVAANNFPRRARGLAREVFLTRPDVIGLQEVSDLTVNGLNIGPPFVDHLETTLDALAAVGLHYVVAGTVEHLDVTLPLDVDGDTVPDLVRVQDRDVILVKAGLPYTTLGGDYLDGGLCGVAIPAPVLMVTLQSTPSQDGCTYTVVAQVDSPVGTITVKRGFLGVDVRVAGKTYRVVNTHLEVRQPDPTNPGSAIIQFLQSVELAETLAATTPAGRTLITLGDFNSSPLDPPLGPIVPPYQVLVGSGFADAWDTNALAIFDPDGFTCCQQSDLANASSLLSERIDLIFVRDVGSFQPLALVTGRVPLFPLATPPHWASDHGGVFGTLIFPR